MLTTTPRLSPCVEATPRPASRSSPPGSTSATTAITFAVPMSSPTTRSLYSLAIDPSVLSVLGRRNHRRDALQAHRIAVVVPQVGVLERALVATGHLRQRADEALGARQHLVVAAAAQLHLGTGVQLDPPRAAPRQRQPVDA